jgi:hypothetical protein
MDIDSYTKPRTRNQKRFKYMANQPTEEDLDRKKNKEDKQNGTSGYDGKQIDG